MVELLISLSILAGLIAMATPEVTKMVAAVRLRSAMSTMADGFRLTRYEAIKSNARAVMCKSFEGAQCSLLGDWSQGWIIFQDRNNNAEVDFGERIWYRQEPMLDSMRMVGNSLIKNYVSYTPFGRAETLSGAFQAGTVIVCFKSAVATDAFSVIINNMGRPRVQKTIVPNCS